MIQDNKEIIDKMWMLVQKKLVFFVPFLDNDDLINLYLTAKITHRSIAHYADICIIPIFKKILASHQTRYRIFFKRLFMKIKFDKEISSDIVEFVDYNLRITRNRVKNPSGNDMFNNWNKLKNGGDGWAIERGQHLKRFSVFVGSFSPCELEQKISIPLLDQPWTLIAGVYVSRRGDCPAEARIKAVLLDKDDKAIKEKQVTVCDELCPNPSKYKNIKIQFEEAEDLKNTTSIKLILWTKDKKFWRGHYAARFADAYVRMIPSRLLKFD